MWQVMVQVRARRPKFKNHAPRHESENGFAPKKAKTTKRKRGKHGGEGKNDKCSNFNKERHFARDCIKPKRSTEHVKKDIVRFVDFR
ncbi:hypothetical protein JRO89_XS04G0111400 [Xanthoceras sorbifolium]|uniref:Uncharacterized protein n=1 Tax=Xanthoceras sorbifolium TaxID=99658 RepID=A0ABQ8I4T0_9ROSI|nr:hypothetical protein JRO89_XS04G0111400 [Xanthoceras sorbifolium]